MSGRLHRHTGQERAESHRGEWLPALLPGKIYSPALTASTGSRICRARADSGTRCSRPPFIRAAGIVQSFALRSISAHRAPNTSPDRLAFKMLNSNASGTASRFRRSATPMQARHHMGARQGEALGKLLAPRQQLIQAPAPPGGVFSGPEPLGPCCVEDPLDPTAQPRGGFVSRLPDWSEHREHVRGLDRVNR